MINWYQYQQRLRYLANFDMNIPDDFETRVVKLEEIVGDVIDELDRAYSFLESAPDKETRRWEDARLDMRRDYEELKQDYRELKKNHDELTDFIATALKEKR